jgi:hypothetical protein
LHRVAIDFFARAALRGSQSICRTRGSSGGAPFTLPEREAPSHAGLLNSTCLTAAPISPGAKQRA